MADWTDQAEKLSKSWSAAQKEVWDSWQGLAGRVASSAQKPQSLSSNPLEWFQQSMSAWSDPVGVAGDAGRQVFGSQLSMMRNLEMLTKAWQMIAPKLDAGQDWRAPLSGFLNDWLKQLPGAGLLDMPKDTGALWQSFMGQWGPLLQPWIASATEGAGSGHLGEMLLGGSAGLSRLFTMQQDELPTMPFASLANIPSIGVAREHQAKILRAFDAFSELRKVTLRFNQMTMGAMTKAVETVVATLVEKGKKGEKIESVRELNRLWLDSADRVFTEMYVTEEYLAAQRELSSAGMTYKIRQQDVVEMVLKNLNLPTRRELDDAYRSMYEMRKEVKALRKALRAHQTTATATAGPAKRNAVKKVPARKQDKPVAAKKLSARKKVAARAKSTS